MNYDHHYVIVNNGSKPYEIMTNYHVSMPTFRVTKVSDNKAQFEVNVLCVAVLNFNLL
jgi:hypothetical protein